MERINVTCGNDTITSINVTNICIPSNETDVHLTTFAKARIVIYIATFILSLIGNGCVIMVTFERLYTHRPITAFKLLITHLAFVDFIFSCNVFVLVPNELYNAEADDELSMCIFKRVLRQVPLEVSVGTIAVIAVERYRGITKDFRPRKWTWKRVFISLCIVWILSFAIYIPSIISIETTRGEVHCRENMSPTQRKFHAIFLLLTEYIVPLSVVAYCHLKIIKVIRNRRNTTTELHADDNEQLNHEQRKTVRILFAVVVGFAVIALPNQIFFAYLDLGNKHQSFSVTWDVLQLMGILLLVHSVFNPIFYSVMDDKFREDVKKICCCCCLKIFPRIRSSTFTTSSSNQHAERYIMTRTNID